MMMYQFYQAQADLLFPLRQFARIGAGFAKLAPCGPCGTPLRHIGAGLALFAGATLTHARPAFGIDAVRVDNRAVAISEEPADDTPFGTLLHFRKEHTTPQPRVLLVAPMSGHFATLLRGTVQVMLPEHDLYITDWKNARDVPLVKGRFGFDEFVDHIVRFLRAMGPGSHVVAVCQPAVAALAAAAVMAEAGDPAAAAQRDADGGTDRHAGQPDQGERARPIAADRVVRAAPDQRGALALSRSVPPCLPRLRATLGVHEHEPRPAHQRPFRPVPQPGRRRPHQRGGTSASSTTSTAR